MSQLKNLATMLMFLYILVVVSSSRNIIAILILIILSISYFCTNLKLCNSQALQKNELVCQRDVFINSLSHDLRIPIIAQIRALELVKNQKFGEINNAQKDIINQIEQSCRCILNLTSLMINTYKMENNSYKLLYERFNISDVIVSCFDELLPLASEKKITFEYSSDNKNLNIIADREELKKVILNLLASVISNSCIGQKISVILSLVKNKIKLTISSNNKEICTNFEYNSPFTSVGHAIRMGFCKKIIETHHGKIIENNKNGSFSFEIPQYGVV